MNSRIQNTILCVVVAAALLATWAVTANGEDSAKTAAAGARSFTATKAAVTYIDNRPKGHSVGDSFLISANLSEGSATVGRIEFVQSVIDKKYEGIQEVVTLVLADGTINAIGAGFNKTPAGLTKAQLPDSLGVAGGTGAYAGAKGELKIGDGDKSLPITLTLQ
jgi:hypothetical protein